MKPAVLLLTLCALTISAPAQAGGLSSKLSEAGAEWLIGEWTGIDPMGDAFTLTYGQEYDGQAGSVLFKGASLEMKGLIALNPATDEIRQFSVTSTGILVTGTWDDDGSGLTFEATWTMPDGSRKERSYVYQWIDAKTARVTVYDGSRWRSDTSTYEIMLNRAS